MRSTKYLAAFAAAAFLATDAFGQERKEKDSIQPAAKSQGDTARVEVARNVRSSELVGLQVKNKQGKDLGKVEDLVVDLKNGDVRYAALSFGGFAGFGTKLFAVPWQSMTFMLGENDRHFVLDTTPEKLQQQEGFDSSRWPNFGDKKWTDSIDKHYNIDRNKIDRKETETARDATPQATAKTKDQGGAAVAYDTVFRVSRIEELKVINDRNKDLGRVDDLVIDVNAGKVKYAALTYGATLGIGGKLFAVPLHEFTVKHATNDVFLVLNVNEEDLKKAPGFDKDHWPNFADKNWSAEIDRYYDRSAKRPTTVK
jgi:sporulation protein YlmC with PRC-barrel domain